MPEPNEFEKFDQDQALLIKYAEERRAFLEDALRKLEAWTAMLQAGYTVLDYSDRTIYANYMYDYPDERRQFDIEYFLNMPTPTANQKVSFSREFAKAIFKRGTKGKKSQDSDSEDDDRPNPEALNEFLAYRPVLLKRISEREQNIREELNNTPDITKPLGNLHPEKYYDSKWNHLAEDVHRLDQMRASYNWTAYDKRAAYFDKMRVQLGELQAWHASYQQEKEKFGRVLAILLKNVGALKWGILNEAFAQAIKVIESIQNIQSCYTKINAPPPFPIQNEIWLPEEIAAYETQQKQLESVMGNESDMAKRSDALKESTRQLKALTIFESYFSKKPANNQPAELLLEENKKPVGQFYEYLYNRALKYKKKDKVSKSVKGEKSNADKRKSMVECLESALIHYIENNVNTLSLTGAILEGLRNKEYKPSKFGHERSFRDVLQCFINDLLQSFPNDFSKNNFSKYLKQTDPVAPSQSTTAKKW